ncbi:restriction endonuclease [Alicyclobacillus sp. SO9]|nr:restriction endonuclease [Alicyclobacillus sp. SO9]
MGFLFAFWLSHYSVVAGIIWGLVLGGIGLIIIIVYQSMQEARLKRSGILEVDKMTGRTFENYLGHLFRSQGYRVKVTRESGDYGADLVLEKNGSKIVVQAKRYQKNVSIKAVQEVQASLAYYGAQQGWVVTNSGFTASAVNLARSNGIRLVGRKELMNLMLTLNDKSDAKKQSARI